MRERFHYTPSPSRVIFGAGAIAEIGPELDRLGLRSVLLLSTPEQRGLAEAVATRFADRVGGIHAEAVMHVPIDVAKAARDTAAQVNADGFVAIGGGSTIGLGKAIALVSPLPILAVPTTYAGSEMTPIWGLTEGGVKKTGRDPRVQPKTVIYDPDLTMTLPVGLSIASGVNAMAHCVEALYAADGNPVVSLMAEEGIRALAAALPRLQQDPRDREGRSEALYGAWLGGSVLGLVSMALHHKLCHTLGGTFNLPHAETHTILLPHTAAYNAEAAPEAMVAVRRALGGTETAGGGLWDLAAALNAPRALRDLGITEAQLDHAADLATQNPYPNPRPLERESLRALLQAAYTGQRPIH